MVNWFHAGAKSSKSPVCMIGILEVEWGLISYQLKDGYFNSEDYVQYLEGSIDLIAPQPVSRETLIILDNLSLHKSK